MNNLTIFENAQFGRIRTVEENGKVYFCGKDVATALGYANTKKAISDHCKINGVTKCYLIDKLGRQQQAKFIDESNLYRLITHSKLPEAEKFEIWIFDEVLPSIRRNGSYSVTTDQSIQLKEREVAARELNARTRSARTIMKLAEMTFNATYRETLIARAANTAIGQNLLPLPRLAAKTYSAEEIGKMLGITANKVGRLTNAYSLKTSEYGDWFADKAKTVNKEVQTFRYYGTIVEVLREILAGGAA